MYGWTKKQAEEQIKNETIIPWSEDFKPNGYVVTFDGDQFEEWAMSLVPERFRDAKPEKAIPLGKNMFYRVRVMPIAHEEFGFFMSSRGFIRSSISLGPRRGACRFSRPVKIPQIIKKDTHEDSDIWMSLTPMEVLTQRPGIRKARGHVLIGGLGMGWFARRCCEKKNVKSVTVREIDPDVVRAFTFFHPKLAVITGDAYDTDLSKYDSVLFDIWPGYGRANWDRKFKEVQSEHPNMWGWGDIKI